MKRNTIVTHHYTGDKFLLVENANNTLATIVMLQEVTVYWIDGYGDTCYHATEVTDPKTIYGACPNRFGIKIS